MKKPLTDMNRGEKGTVSEILSGRGHSPHTESKSVLHLKHLGLQVGTELLVITRQPFGPVVIEIDDTEIAIGRGMAGKICVEVIT
jgi:Fe2+ transport system protein FeoA